MRRQSARPSISRWPRTAGSTTTGGWPNTTPFAPPWDLATGKLPERRQWLQVGALQHRGGLLPEQRPGGQESRQAQGNAGAVPDGGRRNTTCCRWTTRPSCGSRRRDRARSPGRRSSPTPARTRHSGRQCARRHWTRTSRSPPTITVPKGGAEGMIVTFGGRFGGYGMYLLKGKPVFVYNLLDLERFRWEGGVGGEDLFGRVTRSPASTRSCSTSSTTVPGPARAARACSRSMARRWRAKTLEHTDSAHDDHRRDLSTSESIPARSGRQLQAALPLHGSHRQADHQARAVPTVGGGPESCFGSGGQGQGLASGPRPCCGRRVPHRPHPFQGAGRRRGTVASCLHWPVNSPPRAPVAQWIEQPPPKR